METTDIEVSGAVLDTAKKQGVCLLGHVQLTELIQYYFYFYLCPHTESLQ